MPLSGELSELLRIKIDAFHRNELEDKEMKFLKPLLEVQSDLSHIPSKDELITIAEANGFKLISSLDVSDQIKKSVNRMYYASLAGMIGTKMYNLFKNASKFSKIHYKSGIAQKKAYHKGDWKYILFAFEKI